MTEQWRVGRRNPHNVYRQHGDEPRGMEHDDHDDSLGYFRLPEDARRAVDAVNGAPAVEVATAVAEACQDCGQMIPGVLAEHTRMVTEGSAGGPRWPQSCPGSFVELAPPAPAVPQASEAASEEPAPSDWTWLFRSFGRVAEAAGLAFDPADRGNVQPLIDRIAALRDATPAPAVEVVSVSRELMKWHFENHAGRATPVGLVEESMRLRAELFPRPFVVGEVVEWIEDFDRLPQDARLVGCDTDGQPQPGLRVVTPRSYVVDGELHRAEAEGDLPLLILTLPEGGAS